jgi:hypothetical protein
MKTAKTVSLCVLFLLATIGRSAATMPLNPGYAVYYNSVAHPDNTVTVTTTLQGSTNFGGCQSLQPPQYYHSPHLKINNVPVSGNGQIVAPCAYISISGNTVLSGACLTNGVGCNVVVSADVFCSILGGLLWQIISNLRWELAFTMVYGGGPAYGCVPYPNGVTLCNFTVNNWCTAATSPPDANLNGTTYTADQRTLLPFFAETASACVRVGTSWLCSPINVGVIVSQGVFPFPLSSCTHNP